MTTWMNLEDVMLTEISQTQKARGGERELASDGDRASAGEDEKVLEMTVGMPPSHAPSSG